MRSRGASRVAVAPWRGSGIRRLVLAAALALPVAPSAHAQSMNVDLIVEEAAGRICLPLADSRSMHMAMRAAEEFGYRVRYTRPANPNAARASDVEMVGSHQGVLRLNQQSDGRLICAIGIHEAGADQIAGAAEPYLRAHGFEPVLDQREPPLPVSIWRRDDAMVVIAPSSQFRPGSEFTLVAVVGGSD